MMGNRKYISFLFMTALLTGTSLNSSAQGTGKNGVGNEEVTVVKEYEATVKDAQKINIPPDIPEVEEKTPVLKYDIPSRDFKDFSFEANPLRPIALSPEKLVKYNTSFIKLGFGSQLMPLAQLAYNDNKTKNLEFGFWYDHLSAMGYKIKNQRFSDDAAGLYLKYFAKKVEIGTNFTFRNYRTHFYAADTTTFKESAVRQVFRTYDAQVYFKNATQNKANINFNQSVNFNYLQETYGKAKEWYVGGNTDFSKGFKQYHAILANFNFDISDLKNDSLTLQRNIFRLGVGYGFNNDDWKAHGIFGVSLYGSKPFFYADVHLEKRLYEHAIIAYINYTHLYQKNSLNSLAQTNNFIWNRVDIKNTLNGDLGIGLKGTALNLSYNLAFHLNHINNLALFVNDTLDMKRFLVVYEPNMLIYNFHFEGGYNIKEWLRLSVLGDYNYYALKQQAHAWHQPAFKATLRANYIWKNKISITLDLYGITSTYAKISDAATIKIKVTADINVGVDYIFNKHISFFGMVNNVANIKYQRWYLYPGYGINGMVGAKFSF